MIIMIRGTAVLLLLAVVDRASGFVGTKRGRHRPSPSAEDVLGAPPTSMMMMERLSLSQHSPISFQSPATRASAAVERWSRKNRPTSTASEGSNSNHRRRVDRLDEAHPAEVEAEAVRRRRSGMAMQLGGWSYARTVFSNLGKSKSSDGEGDASSADSSGAAHGAPTSAGGGSGGGASGGDHSRSADGAKASSEGGEGKNAQGVGLGGGGGGDGDDDGNDDDEDEEGKEEGEGGDVTGDGDGLDSWDDLSLSEFADGGGDGESREGFEGIDFSDDDGIEEEKGESGGTGAGSSVTADAAPQEFEVVCDGDVCERRPVGGPDTVTVPPVQTGTAGPAAAAATSTSATTSDTVEAAAAALAAADKVGVGVVDAPSTKDRDMGGIGGGAAAAGVDSPGDSGAGSGGADPADPTGGAVAGDGDGDGGGDGGMPSPLDDPDVAQLVAMGWEVEESAAALLSAGGDVVHAAEALAAKEEEDLERYEEGLADLQQRGWDSDVAMSAMREANGNSTAALEALKEEDRMLSMQFEQSIEEMVEHGWDEEVARKALLMQWQKDIEGRGGSRKDQKQFEKTVQGVHEKGVREGKTDASSGGKGKGKDKGKSSEPPAPTPAKREDVVFEVTDKTLQKVVMESPVPVILDVYAEWCGPCKQLTPALEEAAMRSGGMFRVAKVDAEKQKGIAEVLGIFAFPSVFGMKDGIILDNFVGGLPQDEMQSFMMGVVMGMPPSKDKELREHQKGQAELRGISRKLAHVAGLAVLGSRKKETLCLKVDKALARMLKSPPLDDDDDAADVSGADEGGAVADPAIQDASAIAAAKKSARTVITVLMSAYKFPEDPKYRSLSTSSKVYREVLAPHQPMLEVLRLAGFRHKDGDETHLTLLHRNMAVLASVQDRVEAWNKSVKMPQLDEDSEDEYDSSDEEDEEERERIEEARARLATMAKLEITHSTSSEGKEAVVRMSMEASASLGDLFGALQKDEGFGEDLVLTTSFPKRELAASDQACHSSTLLSLGLAPSARLTATTAAVLKAEKAAAEGGGAEEAAARRAELKAKMRDKSRDRKGSKKAGSLFGAKDGIIEIKKGKHAEYFGGDSTVTLAAEDTEEEEGEGNQGVEGGDWDGLSEEEEEDDFGQSVDLDQNQAGADSGDNSGSASFSSEEDNDEEEEAQSDLPADQGSETSEEFSEEISSDRSEDVPSAAGDGYSEGGSTESDEETGDDHMDGSCSSSSDADGGDDGLSDDGDDGEAPSDESLTDAEYDSYDDDDDDSAVEEDEDVDGDYDSYEEEEEEGGQAGTGGARGQGAGGDDDRDDLDTYDSDGFDGGYDDDNVDEATERRQRNGGGRGQARGEDSYDLDDYDSDQFDSYDDVESYYDESQSEEDKPRPKRP